ncbi:MAG: DUF370 domain-containing protein [Oscillospiraceae bacterium]|jgi:hypothetical protein|nr:DUF370 domain-containing protein [Oscillospiraceae bacterium]
MYLHIGNGMVVNDRDIVGIFDIDYCSVDRRTRDFLSRAQKEGRIVDVSQEIPKSFIVVRSDDGEKVYITNISPATLTRRSEDRDPYGAENM